MGTEVVFAQLCKTVSSVEEATSLVLDLYANGTLVRPTIIHAADFVNLFYSDVENGDNKFNMNLDETGLALCKKFLDLSGSWYERNNANPFQVSERVPNEYASMMGITIDCFDTLSLMRLRSELLTLDNLCKVCQSSHVICGSLTLNELVEVLNNSDNAERIKPSDLSLTKNNSADGSTFIELNDAKFMLLDGDLLAFSILITNPSNKVKDIELKMHFQIDNSTPTLTEVDNAMIAANSNYGTKNILGTVLKLREVPGNGLMPWLGLTTAVIGDFTDANDTTGTTIKKGTVGSKNITVPTTAGIYRLYLVDEYNRLSAQSTNTATVIAATAAPTLANTLTALPLTLVGQGGAAANTVTLTGVAGLTPYLAPAGTKATEMIANGKTITKAAAANSVTVPAPTTSGTYHLYLVNANDQVSPQSTNTVTIDNTAPTQAEVDAVITANTNAGVAAGAAPGAQVTLNVNPGAGHTVWIAPLGTTIFTANATTITKAAAAATNVVAATPTTRAEYYVYLLDICENVSPPSTFKVTT